MQTSRSVKKEGRGGARAAEAESPSLQLMKDHGEAGCPPAVHGVPWWSRYPPVVCGRDPTPQQVDA